MQPPLALKHFSGILICNSDDGRFTVYSLARKHPFFLKERTLIAGATRLWWKVHPHGCSRLEAFDAVLRTKRGALLYRWTASLPRDTAQP
jgi:hypothetical protein